MKVAIITLCALCAISCGEKPSPPPEKPKPTARFVLKMPNGTQVVDYSGDWIEALPKVTRSLRLAWDDLQYGQSYTFNVRTSNVERTMIDELRAPRADVGTAMNFTTPSYRFFKLYDTGGFVQIEGDEHIEIKRGKDLEWEDVELALRVEWIPIFATVLGDGDLDKYNKIAEDLAATGRTSK